MSDLRERVWNAINACAYPPDDFDTDAATDAAIAICMEEAAKITKTLLDRRPVNPADELAFKMAMTVISSDILNLIPPSR